MSNFSSNSNLSQRFSFVRVASEDKTNPNDSNSNFNVNLISSGGNNDQVTKVSFKYATCPNTFYNVASDLNKLVFVDSGAPLTQKTVTIPAGQYNATQFISALAPEINALISAGTVTISLSPITQRLTFTSPSVNLQFLYAPSTMANILGFDEDTFSVLSLTMTYPINLTGETEVYIHSKTLSTGRLTEASGNFSVLGVIPLNVGFGETAYYTAPDEGLDTVNYAPFQTSRSIQQIDITLRSRDGRILELPNNSFFAMVLQVYYK